jgi:hypothetical protein
MACRRSGSPKCAPPVFWVPLACPQLRLGRPRHQDLGSAAGFDSQLASGCGQHAVHRYIAEVNALKREFAR